MRSCPLTGQLSAFLCISGNRKNKMTITLAGKYPAGTKERLQALLHHEAEIRLVDTPEAYDAMTDAEIVVLRVFKAPRAFIERNPNLKMILRWGVGVDSVDLDAAGEHGVIVTNTPGANAAWSMTMRCLKPCTADTWPVPDWTAWKRNRFLPTTNSTPIPTSS